MLSGRPSAFHHRTWIAVSLAARDDCELVALAQAVRPWADAVEIRLDWMDAFHLEELLAHVPLPAVVTYRPRREGGKYDGDESARLAVLEQAAAAGAYAVDVEWDAVADLGPVASRLIVSRHFFDAPPADLERVWANLAPLGDIVKIAVYTPTLTDALRVCRLWLTATKPTIAIAMGATGIVSRLCAPHFPTAFLTYAAASAEAAVAPGQVSAREMHERYHVHRITPHTTLWALIAPDATSSPRIPQLNREWAQANRDEVVIPLPITPEDDLHTVESLALELGFRLL